jgi:hypothetical protein
VSLPRPNHMGVINIEEKRGMRGAPAFGRYVGIDYSGAQTAETSLPGLRLYLADRMSPPCEVQPPVSPRKYWIRRGLAHWLAELLAEDTPTLVGIDHAFGFPLRYFEQHALPLDWTAFLDDFQRYWPTDAEHLYVESVRDGSSLKFGSSTHKMPSTSDMRSANSSGAILSPTTRGALSFPWIRSSSSSISTARE